MLIRRLRGPSWKSRLQCRHFYSVNDSQEKIIFSGIQPTGIPHLGNYLGALKNWVALESSLLSSAKIFYSIVDLHAMTIPYDRNALRQGREDMWCVLHAAGIDMERCTVFEQSAVPEHAELNWILSTLTPMGELNRMTQWKAKLEQAQSKGLISRAESDEDRFGCSRLGLFAYPVLQAADILLYNATHVPVGEDQSQHIETTRFLARQFNQAFPMNPTMFHIPQIVTGTRGAGIPLTEGSYPRVMSLTNPTKKMSKSDVDKNSKILLTTPPEEIRSRIKQARTDSIAGIYSAVDRPAVSNLLQILATLQDTTITRLEEEVKDWTWLAFKERLAEEIVSVLTPIQERYREVHGDRAWLERVRKEGNEKARQTASQRMTEIRKAVGLL